MQEAIRFVLAQAGMILDFVHSQPPANLLQKPMAARVARFALLVTSAWAFSIPTREVAPGVKMPIVFIGTGQSYLFLSQDDGPCQDDIILAG